MISSQLTVDIFPSRKAAKSLRGGSLLEESLPIITPRAVGVLESEPTLSSSLSPEEDKDKASGGGFLETKEAETLLEEHLAMRQVWGFPVEYTHLPALELALESRLSESGDSPTHLKMS